jgi:hypothetical protein
MLVLTQKGRHVLVVPEDTVRLDLKSETAQLKVTTSKGESVILANCTSQASADNLKAAMETAHSEGHKYFCVPSWCSRLAGHLVVTKEGAYV